MKNIIPKLFCFVFFVGGFSALSVAQERLIVIGGGKRPPEVLAKFAELGGGAKGKILVVTWASGEPKESFAAFRTDLEKVSKIEIENAPFAPLTKETTETFLQQLKTASGVFFTGGDQNRIMEVLKNENLFKALHEKYKSGAVFGGTSAGTAIMSPVMITGEGNFTVIDGAKVETKKGLGLLPASILDQHFIKRQRQNRLIGLVLQNPNLLGIGIDEDTALIVSDNRFAEVAGSSQVIFLDLPKQTQPMRLFLLKNGEKFDLKKRRKVK